MSEFRRVPRDIDKMLLREKQGFSLRDDVRQADEKYATPRVCLSLYTANKEMIVRAIMELCSRL